MRYKGLWWFTILLPGVAIALFDYLRHIFFPAQLHLWPETVVLMLLVFVGASVLTSLVVRFFERRKHLLLEVAREMARHGLIATEGPIPFGYDRASQALLDRLRALLKGSALLLYLSNEGDNELNLVVSSGLSDRVIKQLRQQPGLVELAFASRRDLAPSCLRTDQGGLLCSFLSRLGFRSVALVPIHSQSRHLGVLLLVCRSSSGAFAYDQELFQYLGASLGASIENARLLAKSKQQAAEAAALHSVAVQALSPQDLKATLDLVTRKAKQLLHAEASHLCLFRNGDGKPCLVAEAGNPSLLMGVPPEPPDVLLPALASSLHLGNGQCPDGCPVVLPTDGKARLSAPLATQGRAVGYLCVVLSPSSGLQATDSGILTSLATQAAIAVENARLRQELEATAAIHERERIAREIHDSLAQVLGYLNLRTRTASGALAQGQTQQAQAALAEMAEVTQSAYRDVREAILGLRESIRLELGLLGVLREYLDKFGRQSGIRTKLVAPDGPALNFAPSVEVQLIRVIQEALSNVRKHAHARQVTITLEREAGQVRIVVEDDGQGMEPVRLGRAGEDGHFGLLTMQERMKIAGGRLEIHSAAGAGTRVVAVLPQAR